MCSTKYEGDEKTIEQCKLCEEVGSRNGAYHIKVTDIIAIFQAR